ncbi:MAG: alcohol dehydrogenase catalytic domain-containing protein [Phycisphaerae bacterium]|nr:alcohol dehydrogenase catalytic domain-containing protein [Phycisphaerae bacterium]
MRAIVLTALRQMELMDVPDPSIENDEDVLLKIEKVGICGSDVHYYETGKIGRQVVEYPFIIGHECSATVRAVGPSVTRVKVGDAVVVDPAASCGRCDQCRMGRENTCHTVRFLGAPGQGGGCLCEYLVMPQECCYPTNGAISLDQGALCEPFSIGVYAVKRGALPSDARIAILGTGPIGLSVLAAAKAEKAEKIYVTDKIDTRLEAAKGLGADWAGNPDKDDIVGGIAGDGAGGGSGAEPLGLDVVFECCGQQDAVDQAIDILRPGGTLVLVGTPRKERVSFDVDKLRRKEIEVRYIRRQNHCVRRAMDLIGNGEVSIDFMITHRFGLDETKKAFDLVAAYGDGVIKAMIDV